MAVGSAITWTKATRSCDRFYGGDNYSHLLLSQKSLDRNQRRLTRWTVGERSTVPCSKKV